jgi:hypothetical protein
VLNIVVGYVNPVCSHCLCQIALLPKSDGSSSDYVSLFAFLLKIANTLFPPS